MVKQAKGVVGNIAPWNFPIECALIMVADMLAAGNRVIVKTSELAPNTAGKWCARPSTSTSQKT